MDLPSTALAIRQPWAWAILHGGKDIENRTTRAVSLGNMKPGRICILASKGMTRAEYEDAREFMVWAGAPAPPMPCELTRGAIVGTVTVTEIVKGSDSPWFVGTRGLVLADADALALPIPAAGQLGYFEWSPGGDVERPLPWMQSWPDPPRRRRAAPAIGSLFD